jgi:indolepyruvate ferredoxin oxidoreductase
MDASASVDLAPDHQRFVLPVVPDRPAGGLHLRWPDRPLDQELRLQRHKLYAALAFVRANGLDRVVLDSPAPRLGIVTTGKSYLDVRQALDDLGIDAALAADVGLRLYKVAMSWPLEREGVRRFAEGLDEVLVIEEKRALIENQLKEQLYNWREDVRPRVIGKFDEAGEWVLPSTGELTPARIARVVADRLRQFVTSPAIEQRLRFLEHKEAALARPRAALERRPHFCSGCPHNTSTALPAGSRALGGIGCHYMATWMDRGTVTFTQMGGEGVPWIGQAPFTDTRHVFANLGDGTYFHSGLLAIRAAVAAGVNITYKILHNDAVAMTGGQPIDGELGVARITRQLHGEGVRRIVVVSDAPERHRHRRGFARGVELRHRDTLDAIQRELRETAGVTVIVYDQACAAEKRRRRKRGTLPEAPRRAFINEAVCEGCGDCSVQSNCLSVVPVDTPLGRKRAIDQGACNVDLSCLKGYCPSFVTVDGAQPRRPAATDEPDPAAGLPEPTRPNTDGVYDIVIAGVGGTGVTTLAALLGTAAHLEGAACSVLDMTGLAQKFGAVTSHVRIARHADPIHAARISAGNARLLLGCDLVVAASAEALGKCDSRRTRAAVSTHESMTAAFLREPELELPTRAMREALDEAVGGQSSYVDAARLATRLLGDATVANLLLLGVAWQRGLVPVGASAIDRAIALNGVAIEANRRAFAWGRRWVEDRVGVERAAGIGVVPMRREQTLDELVEDRSARLETYQDPALAKRFAAIVAEVRQVESARVAGASELTRAVAEAYAKLLAYKDEYEVARLYTDGAFRRQLENAFEDGGRVTVHLAPPLLTRRDRRTGRASKRAFGPWIWPVLRLLARMRWLRGTPLDLFGYSHDRRLDRALVREYESLVATLLARLAPHNHDVAVELASLAISIRGFGPVRQDAAVKARARRAALLERFLAPAPGKAA